MVLLKSTFFYSVRLFQRIASGVSLLSHLPLWGN